MNKINEVLIFRVPNKIYPHPTMFPSQGVAIICDFLLKNNIKPIVHDISHLLDEQERCELLFNIKNTSNIELILDGHLEGKGKFEVFFNDIISKVDLHRFPVILISIEAVSPLSTIVAALLAKHIKKVNREIVIILGGESVDTMSYGVELIRKGKLNSSIDFIVKLNYIENIMTIIKCIEEDKVLPEMPSIIYYDRKKSKVIETPSIQEVHRLGKLDFSNFNLARYEVNLVDYLPRKVVSESEKKMLLLPVSFIYGCPNKCAFCGESFSNFVRYLEPREVVRVISELILKYKTRYFMFLNNTLNIHYDYVDELCERIIESGIDITWSDCVHFRNLDKKILIKMKKAGAVKLVFGLETASDKMLEFCQKGTTSQEAKMRLKWSHEAGIWNAIEIIAGLPHEREEDIKETINFINSNSGIIDEMYLNHFKLYPFSCFFEEPDRFGIENIKDNGLDLLQKLKMGSNAILDDPHFRYSFDEKNGLKWGDKMEQILCSYNNLIAFTKISKYPVTSVNLQILLYLCRNIPGQGDIKKFFRSFSKRGELRWGFVDRLMGLAGSFIKKLNPSLFLILRKLSDKCGLGTKGKVICPR